MELQDIIDGIDEQLFSRDFRCLSDAEKIILKAIWNNKTYSEIAKEEDYSRNYLSNVVAPELYKKLSQLVSKRVTKKNCKGILKNVLAPHILSQPQTQQVTQVSSIKFGNDLKSNNEPIYPSGSVPLHSPYYLPRSNLESQIIEEVTKDGALVRVKAPQERGKTSILLRVMDICEKQLGYKTISIDLQKAEQDIFADTRRFLRWICINCARQLKLSPQLDEYWEDDLGCNMAWTIYLEDYILEEIEEPIVLAFDEVNEVFAHPNIARDFLPLLRSCFEEAKKRPLWQKLRLIVVHSTEIYVSLRLEQSPFNVGFPIEVSPFTKEQTQQLAQKYQLKWDNPQQIDDLMNLVAGHPALIHLAIYHLYQGKVTFDELLKNAASPTGIYGNHLQRHWIKLQDNAELANAFRIVCYENMPVSLDPVIAHQLTSMGLTNFFNNQVTISCQLYKDYFYLQWNEV